MEKPCRSTQREGAGKDLGDILSTSLLMQLFHLWGGGGALSPPPLPGWSRLAADIASQSFFFTAVSPYSLPISLSRLSAFIPPTTPCAHPPPHRASLTQAPGLELGGVLDLQLCFRVVGQWATPGVQQLLQ